MTGPVDENPGAAVPASAEAGDQDADRTPSSEAMIAAALVDPAGATPVATLEIPESKRRWGRRRPDPPGDPDDQPADWGWVEEWRRGGEPTPWAPGLALAAFAALIIGSAVYVISQGLTDRPIVAVIANVVVAAGLAPALWMSRRLPVLRWVALGGALGTVIAWISIVFFPNF